MILAIDVGGTSIKYAYIQNPREISRKQIPTNLNSYEELEALVLHLIQPLKTKIKAVSFSFPGTINDDGKLITAGAVKRLDGIELKKRLEDKINLPVIVENDAHCAAIAEMRLGNGRDVDDFITFTIGTGIGGSIICDKKILKGKQFIAGELGMMLINRDKNDFERLHDNASTSALINKYNKKFKVEINDAREILEKYDIDMAVSSLVDDWALNIAYGIFNLSASLNPQKILIGGGISENDKLIPIINKALNLIPFWDEFKCEIETCKFRNNAGILGSYCNAVERLGLDNVL